MSDSVASHTDPAQPVARLASALVAAGRADAPWDTRASCDVLESELAPDFELRRLEPEEGHRSLIATHRFSERGPTLILCGHLDVVPAGPLDDWTLPPFGGVIKDGLLHGRGSCDMKGAVAALVVAAHSAAASSVPLAGRLVLALVADEEAGGRLGAGAFVTAEDVTADAVIVAEPSDGGVCVSHRGMCFVEVVSTGRAGHASMPDRAESAVELMIDVLARLRTLRFRYDAEATTMRPGFALGTMIEGGTKVNIIPDRCRATIDVRKVTGMTDASVLADIVDHLDTAGVDMSRVQVSVQKSGEPAECETSARIVAVARDAFAQEKGADPPVTQFPAATDGFWFATYAGAPTLMAFGPGSLDGCHVVDERIPISELEAYARIYGACIVAFLARSSRVGQSSERG